MNRNLFPVISMADWVDLWQRGYSSRYGPADDSIYRDIIIECTNARNDIELATALVKLLERKEPTRERREQAGATTPQHDWCQLQSNIEDIPKKRQTGAVYNTLLAHVFTKGRRPMIDQHAWRGYCYVIKRAKPPEFPSTRQKALQFYREYEQWFQEQVAQGIDARKLDKSLMAFGQFCSRQFRPLIEHPINAEPNSTQLTPINPINYLTT